MPAQVNVQYTPTDRLVDQLPDSYTVNDTSGSMLTSPRGALYRSLMFPGLGQWYNGKKIKSALVFTAETGCVAGYFYERRRLNQSTADWEREFYRDERNKYAWWFAGVIIYSMIDAYVDAYLKNFDADMNINVGRQNSSVLVSFNVNFSPD
ncbi:DUF5683 domain-containing protein [candidate division KSB1 bacterium]